MTGRWPAVGSRKVTLCNNRTPSKGETLHKVQRRRERRARPPLGYSQKAGRGCPIGFLNGNYRSVNCRVDGCARRAHLAPGGRSRSRSRSRRRWEPARIGNPRKEAHRGSFLRLNLGTHATGWVSCARFGVLAGRGFQKTRFFALHGARRSAGNHRRATGSTCFQGSHGRMIQRSLRNLVRDGRNPPPSTLTNGRENK